MSAIDTTTATVASDNQVIFVNDDELRPSGHFPQGYRVLAAYQDTAFGEVVLKKTKNGHRAKSGVKIERNISPKRGQRTYNQTASIKELSCSQL